MSIPLSVTEGIATNTNQIAVSDTVNISESSSIISTENSSTMNIHTFNIGEMVNESEQPPTSRKQSTIQYICQTCGHSVNKGTSKTKHQKGTKSSSKRCLTNVDNYRQKIDANKCTFLSCKFRSKSHFPHTCECPDCVET